MKFLVYFVLTMATVGGIGCGFGAKLPPIPGYHWVRSPFGALLYNDSTGENSASFNSAVFGDGAQVCSFEPGKAGCKYFQTDAQSLSYLADQYKEVK